MNVKLAEQQSIEPGFYRGIKNEEYHAGPGLSSSNLKVIERSPAHFYYKSMLEEDEKSTDALIVGDAFHAGVLEPERFEKEYLGMEPGMTRANKEGKAFMREHADKVCIPYERADNNDWKAVLGMIDAVKMHPVAMDLLSNGEPELSGYWYDPTHPEVLCKLRMDWINKERRAIVDLKSTTDARPYAFTKQAYDKGYHVSAGHYTYGCTHITRVPHEDFYFIAVEKRPPFGIYCYKATPVTIQEGRIVCQRLIDTYAECLRTGEWPCYPEEITDLDLPGYVKRREELTPIFDL